MPYDLRYHPKVKADLKRISADARRRIRSAIESRLTTEPERFGVPLQGALRPYWKLRVGDYRILFWVAGETVAILAILHRKDAYEQAERRIGRG